MAVPASALQLDQTVDIETPELVVLTYTVAGIGSRVVAAIVDLLICLAAMALLSIATLVLEISGLTFSEIVLAGEIMF